MYKRRMSFVFAVLFLLVNVFSVMNTAQATYVIDVWNKNYTSYERITV